MNVFLLLLSTMLMVMTILFYQGGCIKTRVHSTIMAVQCHVHVVPVRTTSIVVGTADLCIGLKPTWVEICRVFLVVTRGRLESSAKISDCV